MAEKAVKDYPEIVRKMIEELEYGQITVIVQDGKVVQIEQTKKIRVKN